MRSYQEFEKWMEDNNRHVGIGKAANDATMNYINAGKTKGLDEKQSDAVFHIALAVTSAVSAGLLSCYHEWMDMEQKEGTE